MKDLIIKLKHLSSVNIIRQPNMSQLKCQERKSHRYVGVIDDLKIKTYLQEHMD